MPRFCANLTMLFTEVEFLDRFEKAAKAGFSAVECQFPYAWEKEQLAERLDAFGLLQVLHNLPAGDAAAGDRGIACIPGREMEFQDGVGRALEYARALKCTRLNCLAGIPPPDAPAENVRRTLVGNLRFAATALAEEGIRLLVEALNLMDVPGFCLVRTADAAALIEEVAHPNVYLQYDVYHMQIMEGNLTHTLRKHLGRIAHIQIADPPGRNEPGTGEINFPYLFSWLDAAGYAGWVGCEFKPSGKTEDALKWLTPFLG